MDPSTKYEMKNCIEVEVDSNLAALEAVSNTVALTSSAIFYHNQQALIKPLGCEAAPASAMLCHASI